MKLSRLVLIFGVGLLLIAEGYFGYKVHTISIQHQKLKADYSTINNITFGLLSVEVWRDKITEAVKNKLENFNLTKSQEADLRKEIESILHSMIKKAVAMINKPQKSIGGKLKKMAFNAFVDEDKLQAQVPAFADQIVKKIEAPASKARLTDLAESKLKEMDKQTYDSTEFARKKVMDTISMRYHVSSLDAFDAKAIVSLRQMKHMTYVYAFSMMGCVALLLGLWWLLHNRRDLYGTLYILCIISALILLLIGLTTTMIEVEAQIKSITFVLVGQNVVFKNQVLFFQSKSILDVVMILIRTGAWDSIFVGVLILCFSILFPITKLISTGLYLLSKKKWAKNKFIEYFAFKSGKWSMADVMVIAILISYIGFNGIFESQLANLNIHTDTLTSITTNNTSIQPGYIVFIGFVILGLILSEILKWITRHEVLD
jgi:hypothetical protein